jgi:hypothetical protein
MTWGEYLGTLAKGQMHRGLRIARLKKGVSLKVSNFIDGMQN